MIKYQESEEMYLETILLLSRKNSIVHSIRIAEELGYSRPSVSRGVNLLVQKGYITVSENGEINFTEAGKEKAEAIYERHTVITELLERSALWLAGRSNWSSTQSDASRTLAVVRSLFSTAGNRLWSSWSRYPTCMSRPPIERPWARAQVSRAAFLLG